MLKAFLKTIINNMLRFIIDISRKKMYYYSFFENLFNQFILANRVKKTRFLNLKY